MTGTVDLPGIGQVRKGYVYAGAAVVAGILAVAYYRSSASAGAGTVAPAPAPEDPSLGMPDDTGTVGGGFGGSSGGTSSTVGDVIANNQQWYAAALSAATDAQWDTMLAAVALGKFLARQPLTSKEAEIVRVGLAAAGQPPQGGPWAIIPEGAPATGGKPPPPGRLRVIANSGGMARVGWDSVSRVSGYFVFVDGKQHGHLHTGTWYTVTGLTPGNHTISVKSYGSHQLSDPVSVTVQGVQLNKSAASHNTGPYWPQKGK